MLFIFDLDHSTIDASHRGALDSNGRGCLETWRALSTPENIAKDRTLPLAGEWRKLLAKGAPVAVCTSRVMTPADYDMLAGHGLEWDYMLSRPHGSDLPAATLKRELIAERFGWEWATRNAVLFDDDISVIEGLTAQGLRVYNATSFNALLARKAS